ncbi:MAG: DUF554 domain-containing protein [Clostridiales bacterium]|nr:DUF554 domain-containing protein [Clostridiales bacterium]
MLAAFVNSGAVLVGAVLGLIFKKAIPEKTGETLMYGLALCTLLIGVSGALKGEHIIIEIISIVIGAIIGEGIDIDEKVEKLAQKLQKRFKKEGEKTSFAEGFISSTLLFCTGSMAIVGSLQAGISANYATIFAKSTIDFTAVIILASTFGFGTVFSCVSVLIYQGAITLLASFISPFLTGVITTEMDCVGSLIMIGLAFNMLKITKLKVSNYIPAIFVPIILCRFL